MKKLMIVLGVIFSSLTTNATIHVVRVWDGYYQFIQPDISIQLGDTVHWLPLDLPSNTHTITSTTIPSGAASFDQIWKAPADTFFEYVPMFVGKYNYECTPHATSHNMKGSITVTDSNSTGIYSQTGFSPDFKVYPNPSSESIFIEGVPANTNYRVFNPDGKQVLSGKASNKFDISTLRNGIYFIELLGDKPRVVRILKQ